MTKCAQKVSRLATGIRESKARPAHCSKLLLIAVAAICGFASVGCVNVQVRMGDRPDTEALEKSLRLGVSTSADVVKVLGEPYGKGRAMFPIDPKPRTMWSYYYQAGNLQDARMAFLFVYFDQDRYDGHLWFSSFPDD